MRHVLIVNADYFSVPTCTSVPLHSTVPDPTTISISPNYSPPLAMISPIDWPVLHRPPTHEHASRFCISKTFNHHLKMTLFHCVLVRYWYSASQRNPVCGYWKIISMYCYNVLHLCTQLNNGKNDSNTEVMHFENFR